MEKVIKFSNLENFFRKRRILLIEVSDEEIIFYIFPKYNLAYMLTIRIILVSADINLR